MENHSKLSLILGSTLSLFLISILYFVFIGNDVNNTHALPIDQAVFDLVSPAPSWVVTGMFAITKAGSVPTLTTVSVLLLLFLFFLSPFTRWMSLYLIVNMIGVSAITKFLKIFYNRPRPEQTEFDGTSSSFPSGHTSGAIAFYGFLLYLVLVSDRPSKSKWIVNSILAAFIFLIAFSRVFGNIHYFTDVLGGIAIGLTWLFICILAAEWTLKKQQRTHTNKPNQQLPL